MTIKCEYSKGTRVVSEDYIKWLILIDKQKMFHKYKNLLGYRQASKLFKS